jgi:CheY-like chemotaxis protein
MPFPLYASHTRLSHIFNARKEQISMATILMPAAIRDRLPFGDTPALTEAPVDAASHRLMRTLLTIEPAAFLTREHARVFRAANYSLRTVRFWYQAVEWLEQGAPDAVLLDVDAIDARVSAINVSARRVVELLHRAAGPRPVIIAVVSQCDPVEIEDVLRAGVQVFVPASASSVCLIQRVEAARARLARPALALTA